MLIELLPEDEIGFSWIDLHSPSEEELLEAGLMYELPLKAVHDCLDLSHLPKFEEHGFTKFILIRSFNPKFKHEESTIEQLTKKVAVFVNEHFILTIHRLKADFMVSVRDSLLTELREEARSMPQTPAGSAVVTTLPHPEFRIPARHIQSELVYRILHKVVDSYDAPIDAFEDLFEEYEDMVFRHASGRRIMGEIYLLKRRLFVCRRMLRLTLDVVRKVEAHFRENSQELEYLRAHGDRLVSLADAALDNLHNLLQLHVSFQSNHTNEIVRVLTIFSAFFMPLTFIAGVYGMNFEFMPETKSPWGYPFAILLMGGISLFIYIWFRKKKWIGNSDESVVLPKFSLEEAPLPKLRVLPFRKRA